jgi:hypothetical protein
MSYDAIGYIGRGTASAVAADIAKVRDGSLTDQQFAEKLNRLTGVLTNWVLREDGMGEREYEAMAQRLLGHELPSVRAFAQLYLDPNRSYSTQTMIEAIRAAVA